MRLEVVLAAHARRHPDKTAVICGDERLSYGALQGDVERLAGALAALGLGPDDKIILYLPNGVAFVRLLRRPKPGIPPFLVTRQQQDWQQWLRDQVADAVRVTWVFPGQVPSYQANGYVMERKTASGAEIRTTDLASPDLAAHGYMVLMTMRRR